MVSKITQNRRMAETGGSIKSSIIIGPVPQPASRLTIRLAIVSLLLMSLCISVPVKAADLTASPSLDRGFRLLYNLDFPRAQQEFSSWEQGRADNPVGPVGEAAGFLFSEFQRLGILESQFYASDSAFKARKKLSPDPVIRTQFDSAINRAQTLARARLAKDRKDRDALFAMTLSSGLQADYAALIEKRNLVSLHLTKDATAWAQQLLAVDPTCYDAHIATGISQYIVGTMAAPVRWFLRLGGVSGDKQRGITELQLTAAHGQYLAPFARILLAIAYVHDKDKPRARALLASLRDEFPNNPLFAREIARLDSGQ